MTVIGGVRADDLTLDEIQAHLTEWRARRLDARTADERRLATSVIDRWLDLHLTVQGASSDR